MRRSITYSISHDIFDRFPAYSRHIVVAQGVENPKSNTRLIKLLREAEDSVRASVRVDDIAEDPRFKPWREAFRSFGAKPNEFRPSVEALVRRVLRGNLLPEISSLVDIGTIACLRHLVPVGGHALDEVDYDIELRLAEGHEIFVPFGSNTPEHPLAGEVIFAENNTVLTRRWVWRQATHTLVKPETQNVVFNIDILRQASTYEAQAISADVAGLITEHCGGNTSIAELAVGQLSVRLNL